MHTNRRLFIKQLGFGAAGLTLINAIPSSGGIVRNNKHSLPRSLPEQQGVSSAGILEFLNDVEKNKIGFHSIIIIRHSHVIAEGWWSPYAPQFKHTLYSLSKSFTSTAVGFAVAEGHLTVDDPVTSFFPDDVPDPISDNLAAMKVKDLLTMSTGQEKEPDVRNSKDVSWVKGFLAAPVEYAPGSRFHYNSMATYMCSAIVQKLTGQPIIEYLKPRLFDPLGIEGMDWESSPQGINVGGWGLRVKTEDIAKFGLLYLQKGMWQGKQILPAAWVEEATSKQVESNPSSADYTADNDWAQGYGYQFWRCSPGGYRGDGAFGQFCIVNPDLDMVIAATSESFNMGASMKSMWNYLLPAVKNTTMVSKGEQKQVVERLKNLTLEFPKANSTSPLVDKIAGKKFGIDANELKVKSISFSFAKDSCTLNVSADSGEHQITCGINKWKKNEKASAVFQLPARVYTPTSETAGVAWTNDTTLVITERFTETAHGDQLTCTFDGDTVSIKFLNSVAQGNPNNPDKRPELKGKLIT